MQVSVVIITKDEQPRLRLSLIALNRQTVEWQQDAEVIIIDDGSRVAVGPADIPPGTLQPRIIRHDASKGRSASRNAGAAAWSTAERASLTPGSGSGATTLPWPKLAWSAVGSTLAVPLPNADELVSAGTPALVGIKS